MPIYAYIKPEVQSEDIKQFEDRKTLSEKSVLMNEDVRYDHESLKK